MTYEEQAIRDRLDEVAGTAPPVGFGPAGLIRRGRRRRQQRRGVAVAASVTALALVVAVPAVASRGGTGNPAATDSTGPTNSSEPTTPTATGAPDGSVSVGADGRRLPGPIPGVSAARARTVARSCARAAGGAEPDRAELRLFNLVTDQFGTHALLYGPGGLLTCEYRGTDYEAAVFTGEVRSTAAWLPGPVALDSNGGNDTGWTVEGRVTGAVATVQVRASGRTARVTPVNGTYIARFPAPGSTTDSRVLVTAYDRGGRVVGTADGEDNHCYTAPGGTVVIRGAAGGQNCRPATPWR